MEEICVLLNAVPPMLCSALPISKVTDVRPVYSNAPPSMIVTDAGIVMLVRFEQNWKAQAPMLSSSAGSVSSDRAVLAKAAYGISISASERVTFARVLL